MVQEQEVQVLAAIHLQLPDHLAAQVQLNLLLNKNHLHAKGTAQWTVPFNIIND